MLLHALDSEEMRRAALEVELYTNKNLSFCPSAHLKPRPASVVRSDLKKKKSSEDKLESVDTATTL